MKKVDFLYKQVEQYLKSILLKEKILEIVKNEELANALYEYYIWNHYQPYSKISAKDYDYFKEVISNNGYFDEQEFEAGSMIITSDSEYLIVAVDEETLSLFDKRTRQLMYASCSYLKTEMNLWSNTGRILKVISPSNVDIINTLSIPSKRYILMHEGKYVKWISWIANWIPSSFMYTENMDEVMVVNDSYLDYELEVGKDKKASRKEILLKEHENLEIREAKLYI